MLNQKGAVADEEGSGRRDDRAFVPISAWRSRGGSQNEEKDRNVAQNLGRGGEDGDPLVNAGRHHRAPRTRRVRGRTRVFGRRLAARRGFFIERGRCRSVRRGPAGLARAARLWDRGDMQCRGCGSRPFRGPRGELERDELAQARARRHDRLEGDQERHDDSDHTSPVAAPARPRPAVLYLRVLRTSIASEGSTRRENYDPREFLGSTTRRGQESAARSDLRASWPTGGRIELTETSGRVYDALMPILWRTRPFVCLLLAISTATGTAAPLRACVCGTPARTKSVPAHAPLERAASAAPTAKSCCPPVAGKRSCCEPSSNSGAAKASCCDDKAPTGRSEKAPAPTPADAPGCHCLTCDCDTPVVPLAPAAPAPTAPDLDDHPTASPVPSGLVPGTPTAASRAARSVPSVPPTDLVISLARLTC